MARQKRSDVLHMVDNPNAVGDYRPGIGLDIALCEITGREVNVDALAEVREAIQPVYNWIERTALAKSKGLPSNPDYHKAIIDKTKKQIELLEQVRDLGLSVKGERQIAELERSLNAMLSHDAIKGPSNNQLLVIRLRKAWEALMPGAEWQIYRLSDGAYTGKSFIFVKAVLDSMSSNIRPTLRSLFD